MDLHFTSERATAEESEAIEGILTGVIPERDLLLPVLHAVQARAGRISPGAVNEIGRRLNVAPAEVHGVASFYGIFTFEAGPATTVHVCDDIACLARGAGELCAELEQAQWPEGRGWKRSPCLGLCERAPAALVTEAAERPREFAMAPVTAEALLGEALLEPRAPDAAESVPQAGQPQLRLLGRIGAPQPARFEALRKAIAMGPEAVVREVTESGLVGRGGAAFPTGRKWEALLQRRGEGRTHYVVCNADESEPGTFKDRVLMEGDPLALIEGLAIAAFAVGARKGYIYVRGEYPLAEKRLREALPEARELFGFEFGIELRRGAGAYICGEETALFNSIEGYRGEPRNKPPFPTQAGLFRQPTVVNNVETLVNIPEIVLRGGAAYARIGTEKSAGNRLFCLSGHIVRPGVYEIPFGRTLRELIAMAGGMGGNGRLQAVLLGGAAGSFVGPKELDIPLTFEGTRAMGATLGSGVVMPFDDSVDLTRILLRIAAFFREESCGQCVPCRIGTKRQEETLERLSHGRPLGSVDEDMARLREVGQTMRDASICGLGQTAYGAVESALERWRLFA